MSLAIIIPDRDISSLLSGLAKTAPDIDIQCWPQLKSPETVTMALVWRPSIAILRACKNLSALMSFGAGVDGLVALARELGLPLARVVDNNLALQMARYVTGQILNHHLQLAQLKGQQADKVWSVPAVARQPSVLLLGAGVLAQAIASALRVLGVEVSLWARSERSDGSVLTGESALQQSLAKCDYLVNTLPLTDETYGFLNAQLFAHCRRGCYLINVARGDHLVEKDLIDALALGQLSGATLDVFSVEPLPQEHPFWHHPQIQITPHCAAITDQESVVAQVVENYRRVEQGMPLCNLVDLKLGY